MENRDYYIDNELIWIDHQNGELGYYVNDNKEAVLCDYIGDASILILPYEVGDSSDCIRVSPFIPDEAFQSCKNVKLVVIDSRFDKWKLGLFLFQNCERLKGVVDLYTYCYDEDYGIIKNHAGLSEFDEFSFVASDFTPKNIEVYDMAMEKEDFYNEFVYRFLNILSERHLEEHLVELLKTIWHYSSLTGEALEGYDDAEVIKHATQFGCNMAELTFLGQLWKKCKESNI